MAGSYTYQDYLDSMEGATRSGLMVADEIIARADGPNGLKAMSLQAQQPQEQPAKFFFMA
jgi:zeta-carotene desaturase